MSQRCLEETSVLRAPIGGRLHRTQTDSMLFYFTFAVPLSSGASRQEEVDRRETGGTIKVASARISVERALLLCSGVRRSAWGSRRVRWRCQSRATPKAATFT